MTICALCDKIGLQPQMKDGVLSFIENFDFNTVDHLQSGYFVFEKMRESLLQTQAVLGEDPDSIKILACQLKAALDAYSIYQEKGISDEIFFDTMGCFPRFIEETYQMTGKLCFDRYFWTTRQVGCHLFRIGALEYEIKPTEDETFISIHIPSDADFSPPAVAKSLQDARDFFAKHFPSVSNGSFRCHSWLMDPQLKGMLGSQSNIIHFQNLFEIYNEGEADTSFVRWLFQTNATNFEALPENTSLQRNVKKHLLAGGVIRTAYGRLKDISLFKKLAIIEKN